MATATRTATTTINQLLAHYPKFASNSVRFRGYSSITLPYYVLRFPESRGYPSRAKGEISTGAVEGLNNKIRVVTRRSYGFRTFEAMEIALYHTLGRLPEQLPHKFC
jgi:hypothetical protein